MQKQINTELLRIILIILIIAHHLILNVFGLRDLLQNEYENVSFIFGAVNSFFIVPVNIFFLISGFYSIKLKYTKILNIILLVYFYHITINFLFVIFGKLPMSLEILKGFIFPISSYWFVLVYCILCVFAPYINLMLQNCDRLMVRNIIILGAFIFCGYSFLIDNPTIGINKGYSFVFAVYLYILGYYLRYYYVASKNKYRYLLIYIYTCLINALLVAVLIHFKKGNIVWNLYNYNNPLILLASISLFIFFMKVEIKSKYNYILKFSSSVFSVYIIHTTNILAKELNYLFSLIITNNFIVNLVFLILYSICIFILCASLDILLKIIFLKNFLNKISTLLINLNPKSVFNKIS